MFTVGQKVYVTLNSYNRTAKEEIEAFEVKSAGRKWITIVSGWKEYKFDPTNKWNNGYQLDGGKYSSPGLVYLSREEIELKNEKEELCSQLRDLCSVYGSKFQNVSNENMKKAIALLKGEE